MYLHSPTRKNVMVTLYQNPLYRSRTKNSLLSSSENNFTIVDFDLCKEVLVDKSFILI